MAKLPPFFRTGAALLGAVAVGALMGCASWGTDPDSVTLCERGFANDPDWNRTKRAGRHGRQVWRQYPSLEFEGKTSRPLKPSTLWFRNTANHEIASCSKHTCDASRCVWRVRLYSNSTGEWRVRSEYDLGQSRRVTGR